RVEIPVVRRQGGGTKLQRAYFLQVAKGVYSLDRPGWRSAFGGRGGQHLLSLSDAPGERIAPEGTPPPPGVVVRSSTANPPAPSGSRAPRALRARNQERVDGSCRPASCRPLRGRGKPCAPLLPVARPGRTRTAIPDAGS